MKKLLILLCATTFGCTITYSLKPNAIDPSIYEFSAVGTNMDYLRGQANMHANQLCAGKWTILSLKEIEDKESSALEMDFKCIQ
jgi:hypothetical protein